MRPAQKAVPLLRGERCTGRGFPSGNSSAGRGALGAVRGRWSGRNLRQTCRRRVSRRLRRGIELPRRDRGTPNNEPCGQCPNRVVLSSIVRKILGENVVENVSGGTLFPGHRRNSLF